jgi:DNA-binding MurR/RpiR family transcriptional regulator
VTIAEEVRDRLDDMSPSERSVARALFAAYPTAGLESLPQLAEAANVTGPTVLRFVRKIGYDGYPDFQRALRAEVQARMEGMLSLYDAQGAPQHDHLLQRGADTFKRGLDETLGGQALRAELPRVVALLSDMRHRAWFSGGRFSGLVAEYLCLLLRMFRPGCAMIDAATHGRALDALEIARNDVVVLFDYRRYQSDTVAVADLADERGAVVVVVTDPWLSPAVESARHVLITSSASFSPIDSMLGGFALAEVLAAEVLGSLGDRGRQRLERVEAAQARMLVEALASRDGARAMRGGSDALPL